MGYRAGRDGDWHLQCQCAIGYRRTAVRCVSLECLHSPWMMYRLDVIKSKVERAFGHFTRDTISRVASWVMGPSVCGVVKGLARSEPPLGDRP